MPPSSDISDFRRALACAKNIIIVSGAGLSAPSGTFIKQFDAAKDFRVPTHLISRNRNLSRVLGLDVVQPSESLGSILSLREPVFILFEESC